MLTSTRNQSMSVDRIGSIFSFQLSAAKTKSNLTRSKYKLSADVASDTNLVSEVE